MTVTCQWAYVTVNPSRFVTVGPLPGRRSAGRRRPASAGFETGRERARQTRLPPTATHPPPIRQHDMQALTRPGRAGPGRPEQSREAGPMPIRHWLICRRSLGAGPAVNLVESAAGPRPGPLLFNCTTDPRAPAGRPPQAAAATADPAVRLRSAHEWLRPPRSSGTACSIRGQRRTHARAHTHTHTHKQSGSMLACLMWGYAIRCPADVDGVVMGWEVGSLRMAAGNPSEPSGLAGGLGLESA
jgi:hypothetical protein